MLKMSSVSYFVTVSLLIIIIERTCTIAVTKDQEVHVCKCGV